MAPVKFNIYIQELGERIKDLGLGFKWGDLQTGVLLYADDVVLIANKADDLQEMLRVADEVGKEYGMRFNGSKSKAVWCGRECSGRRWSLGGGEIEEVVEHTYLGLKVTGGIQGGIGDFGDTMKRVGSTIGMVKYAGGRSAMREWVLREGWKGLVVPRMMYAAAGLGWGSTEVKKMEQMQREFGRWLWKVGRGTPNGWVRGESGWSSMEEREAKTKIKYLVRLGFMEEDMMRKLLEYEVRTKIRSGWVGRVRQLCYKYDLPEWAVLLEVGDLTEKGRKAIQMED